jgi:transcriptional regulator GlxA family with amidase domain
MSSRPGALTYAINIAVYIYEQAEDLDWAGPLEVLGAWSSTVDDVDVFTVGDTDQPVRQATGLRVLVDHTWETAPPIDVLVVPGGNHLPVVDDANVADQIRSVVARGGVVASVCTGAFVLHAAGVLEGKPATTHWQWLDTLRGLGIDVRDDRFVDAGNVITSAGISAGIDMALHLVVRLDSPEKAASIRRYIQYDPEPPV